MLRAVQYWIRQSSVLATSLSSYQSFSDIYDVLRAIRIQKGMKTLEGEDVRAALLSLSKFRNSQEPLCAIGSKRLFINIPEIWDTHWKVEDYLTVFDTFRWHGAAEESIDTMRIIYQKKGLVSYPDSDCWTQVFGSLHGRRHEDVLELSKEVWSLMRHCDATPNLSTFNTLFGNLFRYPDAFDFIIEVYQNDIVPSDCVPDHITLIYLLEAYIRQPRSEQSISEGNQLFEQLLDLKGSASKSPRYWDAVVKWMLFRGDSLRRIKHAMHEQSAVLGGRPRIQAGDVSDTSVSRTFGDNQISDPVTATLDQLLNLALRLSNIDTARAIYDEFYDALGVSHTATTDELRLELLIQSQDATASKTLYDDLRFQGHRISSNTILRLLQTITQNEIPLPSEAQSVFFDLLDTRDTPPETYSSSFLVLANLLLRIGDYPRMRQTLRDRSIDKIPNWKNTLSKVCISILSDPRNIWLEPLLPVYHILQRWAPGTITLSHRHDLMHRLISHGRTDLGLELFHDMRHSDISQPTKETYSIMFSGCAKTRDAQTLEHIHSALRLDSSIEPDATLFNSLMQAYNRTRLPEKALAIWEVLSASSKLPEVETASLALDACVRLPRYGLIWAREIWTFMEDNQIEPTSSSYAALLSVFASVGKWDGMMGLLERMDREKVNARVLGVAYNCMKRDRKEEVEFWARENRPEVWTYLESI